MSQAENLLDSISEPVTGTVAEGNILVGRDRYIVVPESLKKIAVQYDHNVETVTFDCPRYWDDWDFSKMKIYINYMRPDGKFGMYLCENIAVDANDSDLIHFDWTISGHVSEVDGVLSFLVCIKNVDIEGAEITHWNSELNTEMYISKGLRCQPTVLRHYPDIVTQLLVRMDTVEDKTTEDSMLGYMATYLTKSSPNWLHDFFMTDTTLELVREYMREVGIKASEHIVVSTEKPDFPCTWFHVTNVVTKPVVDTNGVYVTDPSTGNSYKLHVLDGKLKMTQVQLEDEKDVYLY